jgi:hypothetical protein
MDRLLAVLAEPITAEQTEVPFVGQASITVPLQAMFVNTRSGEFEEITIADAFDGRLVLNREAPRAWEAGAVLALYDPLIESPRALMVLGPLRKEVYFNARIQQR